MIDSRARMLHIVTTLSECGKQFVAPVASRSVPAFCRRSNQTRFRIVIFYEDEKHLILKLHLLGLTDREKLIP
jgi:hypothetical protein